MNRALSILRRLAAARDARDLAALSSKPPNGERARLERAELLDRGVFPLPPTIDVKRRHLLHLHAMQTMQDYVRGMLREHLEKYESTVRGFDFPATAEPRRNAAWEIETKDDVGRWITVAFRFYDETVFRRPAVGFAVWRSARASA
jgi:hypothetical protein